MKTQAIVSQPAETHSSPLVQVSGALFGIILLILAAAWLAKRFGMGVKGAGNRGLKVSAATTLGPRERVVIVDVEDARLVLGVTSAQITLLHTLPPAPPVQESGETKATTSDFQSLMKSMLKRSGRS